MISSTKLHINWLLLLLLVCIDILQMNRLWGETYTRRFLHHFQRSIFNKSRNKNNKLFGPFFTDASGQSLSLNNNQVESLNELMDRYELNESKTKNVKAENRHHILSTLARSSLYSSKSSLYIDDFEGGDVETLESIGNSLIPTFKKLIGKDLKLTHSRNRIFLIRYVGRSANFDWHYDGEDDSCYRALFMFRKKDPVPPLMYRDEDYKLHSKNFELGEGFFFKGKRIYHGVGKTDADSTIRYMISFQYTTDEYANRQHKSLCSELGFFSLKQGSVIFRNIAIFWLTSMFVYFISTKKHYFTINLHYFLLFVLLSYIILTRIPEKMPESIGTKVNSDRYIITQYIVFMMMHVIYPVESIIYAFYILYTEAFAPSSWVDNYKEF